MRHLPKVSEVHGEAGQTLYKKKRRGKEKKKKRSKDLFLQRMGGGLERWDRPWKAEDLL